MKTLYVLYDMDCGFCCATRRWLQRQATYLPLVCIGRQTTTAARYFAGAIRPGEPDEMVVVADSGEVFRGTSSYLICLWALKAYRGWSFRLAKGPLRPMVRHLFHAVARRRADISRWMGLSNDQELAEALRPHQPVACATPGRGWIGPPAAEAEEGGADS